MRMIACEQCAIRDDACIVDLVPERLAEFYACGAAGVYKPRQLIFHEHTAATGLYLLCQGSVKLYQSDRFGSDYILAIAEPGDVLGELPLDPKECFATSAEALTEVQLCFLPRERLLEFLEEHPTTAVRLIVALSKALSVARHRARDLALKGAESRLAVLLERLMEADADEPRVTQGYSRRELAEMVGITPETTIRLLARFREKGIIATERRAIVVRNPERLHRLAHQRET